MSDQEIRRRLLKEDFRQEFFLIQGEIDQLRYDARRFFAYISMLASFLYNLPAEKKEVAVESIYWEEVLSFYIHVEDDLKLALENTQYIIDFALDMLRKKEKRGEGG